MYFSFLFIGRELTTWSADNWPQISVLLEIIFCPCVREPTFLCESVGPVPWAGREWYEISSWSKERWLNDKTIIELSYSKITWFFSVSLLNYLPQPSAVWQIIDPLFTDKSQCFAQPRTILIVNYLHVFHVLFVLVLASFLKCLWVIVLPIPVLNINGFVDVVILFLLPLNLCLDGNLWLAEKVEKNTSLRKT